MKNDLTVLQKKGMTKKAYKALQKEKRVFAYMNTGTRTMKSKKDYKRNQKIEIEY